MTTAAVRPHLATGGRPERPWMRLIGAELLKLRRRHGLMAFAALLTIVPMLVGYGVIIFLHATDRAHHGPAGGVSNLSGSLDVLITLSGIAAILIGATAGAGDLAAGVFRELVVTGRSRIALSTVRIPACLGVLLVFVAVGYAITAVASVTLAGQLKPPTATLLLGSAGWLAISAATSFAIALGVSSLVGSRSMSIGILLAWQLGLAQLLLAFNYLGVTREALLPAAVARLAPHGLNDHPSVTMSLPAATVTILAWTLVALLAGGWRTATRDA